MNWTKTEDEKPPIGEPIIGLWPVNRGCPSERWGVEPMMRLDKQTADALYWNTDPGEFDVDEWYSPLDDIEGQAIDPLLWTPFTWPAEMPSEVFHAEERHG